MELPGSSLAVSRVHCSRSEEAGPWTCTACASVTAQQRRQPSIGSSVRLAVGGQRVRQHSAGHVVGTRVLTALQQQSLGLRAADGRQPDDTIGAGSGPGVAPGPRSRRTSSWQPAGAVGNL